MRFSAAIARKQPLRNAAGSHSNFIRRAMGAHQQATPIAPTGAAQAKPLPRGQKEQVDEDVPADLDERVRLTGEW